MNIAERGDDRAWRSACARCQHPLGEQVTPQLDVGRVVLAELRGRRIDAQPVESPVGVRRERGAVVAADVEHQRARRRRDSRQDARDLAAQVVDHRRVEPGAIAVVVAVHLLGGVRIEQLDQPAAAGAVALDQRERPRRHALIDPAGKHAGQRLLAEVDQRLELRVAAHPAAVDPSVQGGGHVRSAVSSRRRSESTICPISSEKVSDGAQPSSARARAGLPSRTTSSAARTSRSSSRRGAPVEADVAERCVAHVAHGVRLAGRDHVVARLALLQHPPHRLDGIGRGPVAHRVEVAERDRVVAAGGDRRGGVRDLADEEVHGAARARADTGSPSTRTSAAAPVRATR